jgi:hypothetical protein
MAGDIIIQSERAGDKHYIGYRRLSGGNGICLRSEVQLLDNPDETFYRYAYASTSKSSDHGQ